MTREDYLVTTSVGSVSRCQVWHSDEPLDLDLPDGWKLQKIDGQIHLFDSALPDRDDQTAVTIDPLAEGESRVIELPPSARPNWQRASKVELNRMHNPAPVYSIRPNPQALKMFGPKQMYAFYGQEYLLVRYRPVGSTYQIILSGRKIFTYEQDAKNGDFVVSCALDGLQIELNDQLTEIPEGSSFIISEADFFAATFKLGINWWRFRLFPSPDSMQPVETDETEEDVQEKERIQYSGIIFLVVFSLLIFGVYLAARLSQPPPKVIHAEVVLKTPKIIPPFRQPKKPEKKIAQKKPVVKKKHEVIKLTKHVEPKKRAQPRKVQKKVAKRVAHVHKAAVAAAPKPIHPHHVTPTISPAVARARELAKERAAQQAQVMKSLNFLSNSADLPSPEKSEYKTKSGQFSHMTMVGGMASKTNVLDRIAKGAPGDGTIHTRSAQEVSSTVSFGNRGKGLNRVQGRVSLSDLSGGGSLSGALGGSGGIHVSGPGTMAESEIEKALQKYLSRFEYCYEKALLTDASLGGNLLVQWDIAAGGSVSDARVLRSELNNSGLHHCMLRVLRQIHFPSPQGGSVTVKKTFSFSSSSI